MGVGQSSDIFKKIPYWIKVACLRLFTRMSRHSWVSFWHISEISKFIQEENFKDHSLISSWLEEPRYETILFIYGCIDVAARCRLYEFLILCPVDKYGYYPDRRLFTQKSSQRKREDDSPYFDFEVDSFQVWWESMISCMNSKSWVQRAVLGVCCDQADQRCTWWFWAPQTGGKGNSTS